MADAATIGGSVIGAGIIALAPKAIALVQTWIAKRSEVEIENRRADTARRRRVLAWIAIDGSANGARIN